MTQRQPDAKALKKSLKAQTKQAKKDAKAIQAINTAAAPQFSATTQSPSEMTPAERSAAAAERQVRLQRWRVILAMAGVAIGIATILLTMRPWEKNAAPQPTDQTNAQTTQDTPTP